MLSIMAWFSCKHFVTTHAVEITIFLSIEQNTESEWNYINIANKEFSSFLLVE